MKILIVLAMLVGLIGGYGGLAIAEDGHNVIDQFSDVISGRHDEVPTILSLEICKELPTKVIPGLNLIPMIKEGRTQIGIKGTTPMGQGFWQTGTAEIPIRIIF